jgi:hypothetical protein
VVRPVVPAELRASTTERGSAGVAVSFGAKVLVVVLIVSVPQFDSASVEHHVIATVVRR